MSVFKCPKRIICTHLIDTGSNISAIPDFLQHSFGLPTAKISIVVAGIQKKLLSHFKIRWNKAGRKKQDFLRNNELWLNGEFSVKFEDAEAEPKPLTSTGKRGRPSKPYDISSEKTKKRKNQKLNQEYSLDFVHNSYVQRLRSDGEGEEASIVHIIRSLSRQKKKAILDFITQDVDEVIPYQKQEALGIFIDLDVNKAQYEYMRSCVMEKKCLAFPSYFSIREAKQTCYPPQSSIEITDVSAKVKLQDLLDHTAHRILLIEGTFKKGSTHLKLYSKWGCDGSSGQSEYKQILPGENHLTSDANLFISSLVPIKLVNQQTNEVLWKNHAPSSVRFCRPISIEFSKETPEKTKAVVNNIKTQIRELSSSIINKNGEGVEVKHELYLTMIDGKVSQVLTETSSSAVCSVCGAKPKEMNDIKKVTSKAENENAYQYGLSTLHAWIRFMEMILHISYNLSFRKWSATSDENKKNKQEKKKYVQKRFREELGLHIDKPRQVSGNSNDGNTARRFFAHYQCSASITGVNEELIQRLYSILQAMSSGIAMDTTKFGQYCLDTAQLYVTNYNWYYMPSSVHKILIHGESIIRHYAVLPIGQLSEDAQESRNKDYKHYRLHHSRKCSRSATNEDVLHTLLYTSDPYISSLRKPTEKIAKELFPDALDLLDV